MPERVFSIRGQADLDMRMNKIASTTAADLINDYEEEVLIEIFKKYGEIKNARKLASGHYSAKSKSAHTYHQENLLSSCLN